MWYNGQGVHVFEYIFGFSGEKKFIYLFSKHFTERSGAMNGTRMEKDGVGRNVYMKGKYSLKLPITYTTSTEIMFLYTISKLSIEHYSDNSFKTENLYTD